MEWSTPKISQVYNTSGLKKGHGWNKGIPNKAASKRMKGSNNPNWEGRTNNLRPKADVDCEWDKYKCEVRKATYRSVYQMKKEGLIPENVGKYKGMLQLDHIVPKRQGYEQNIDPLIIGHRNNLRYVSQQENRSKWDTFQSKEIIDGIQQGIIRSLRES